WNHNIDWSPIQHCLELGGREGGLSLWLALLHQFARKKFVKWGNSWRYISIEELTLFLEKFNSYEIKATGFLSAFGRNESQQRLFATIDDLFFNYVIPDKWKYVSYGIAQK
ncbi:hypothetical protein EZS27_006362, partial [termite gut metagenome]